MSRNPSSVLLKRSKSLGTQASGASRLVRYTTNGTVKAGGDVSPAPPVGISTGTGASVGGAVVGSGVGAAVGTGVGIGVGPGVGKGDGATGVRVTGGRVGTVLLLLKEKEQHGREEQ